MDRVLDTLSRLPTDDPSGMYQVLKTLLEELVMTRKKIPFQPFLYDKLNALLMERERVFIDRQLRVTSTDPLPLTANRYLVCSPRDVSLHIATMLLRSVLFASTEENQRKPDAYRSPPGFSFPSNQDMVIDAPEDPTQFLVGTFGKQPDHALYAACFFELTRLCRARFERQCSFDPSLPFIDECPSAWFSDEDLAFTFKSHLKEYVSLAFLWNHLSDRTAACLAGSRTAQQDFPSCVLNTVDDRAVKDMEALYEPGNYRASEGAAAALSLLFLDGLVSHVCSPNIIGKRCLASLSFPIHLDLHMKRTHDYWERRVDRRLPVLVHAGLPGQVFVCDSPGVLRGPFSPNTAVGVWLWLVWRSQARIAETVRQAVGPKLVCTAHEWLIKA